MVRRARLAFTAAEADQPELTSYTPPNPKSKIGAPSGPPKSLVIPARLLIAAGVVLLLAVLAFSVLSMPGNTKKTAVNTFLNEAKQEELLANQPDLPAEERRQHLVVTLDKARQALQVDPQSAEAGLLIQKAQASLDAMDGITRLQPRLLFDLDAADAGAGTQPQTVSPNSQLPIPAGGIVVQGNEAFVMDREQGRVYRCRIAAGDCSTVLRVGESAGGREVGPLLATTLRVGSPVVLDANLAAFVFGADTSAWQAQLLGAADVLSDPKDFASYDGNLYLLASKPGQISKYMASRYEEPPDDWVKDPGSVEQLANPVAMGIDGSIYVLLADGKILVMQGGKVTRTLTPQYGANAALPTRLFTSTDTQDLYLLDPSSGSVFRVTKEGQVRATLRGPADQERFKAVAAVTADEGSGKLYLLVGRQVYEAELDPSKATAPTDPAPDGGVEPAARPTAEP